VEATLLDALAGAAAIYFLVMLLVYTDGPGDWFWKFRQLLGVTAVYDEEGDKVDEEHNGYFWAKVFTCHRCATPYVSIPVIALWFLFPYAVYALGIMGIALWMGENSKT
jgi:hypothetical protein